MKICQSISSISRIAAGVSGFVLPLSQHLVKLNVTVDVLSLADEHSITDLPLWYPLQPSLLKNYIKSFGYSKDFKAALDAMYPSLIHQHGLWLYPSLAIFKWTKKNRAQRVVSPHGMLETWAWRHKNWKKRPIWYLWEKRNLQTAAVIHVTSEQEMRGVRERGITSPIAIIPIGIDVPDILVKSNLKHPAAKKTILFLSRIHSVKGLENLIHAWHKVKRDDWQIIIAGPGDADYIGNLRGLVEKLGLSAYFLFKEAVYGDDKWQLITNADLFVLPSFSENFGIVIAEALACQVPVITTKGTPWEGLIEHNCGWWIDVGVEPLAEALNNAMQLSSEQRQLMGQRGKQYMQQAFNWQESAIKMKMLYKWVLTKNNKPNFVYL
ncbi:glycosyltransferase [Methylobacter psychrophilus]|uniref:glycosyltransferase n=1 Tax=Methylobacter psychrophilus TaxID=96941 RepID=UPI0021D4BAA4|nr:glycosyltransferase [Methylobacter psychrophilus]